MRFGSAHLMRLRTSVSMVDFALVYVDIAKYCQGNSLKISPEGKRKNIYNWMEMNVLPVDIYGIMLK